MSQLDPHGELLYIVSQNSPVFNTNTEILSSPTLSPRIFQTMSQNNTINNNTKNLPDKMESLSLSRFEADSVNTVTSVSNMNNNDNKLPTKYINENSSTATLQNMTQQIIPGASTNKQIITENTSNNNIGNMSNNDDDDIQISPALLASSVGKDIGGVLVPSLSTISLLSLNHTPISEPQATTSTSNTPIFASNSNPWQQRQNSITQQRHQHYQLHHQNSYQNSQSQSQSQSQSTQQQVPRLSPISKTSQPEQDITSPRPALAPTLSNLMNLGSASTSTVTTLSNVTTNHSNKNEEQEVTPNPLTKSLPVPNSITKGSLTFSTNIPQPAAFASNISSSISPSSGITQTPSISPRIPFTTIHSLSPKPILSKFDASNSNYGGALSINSSNNNNLSTRFGSAGGNGMVIITNNNNTLLRTAPDSPSLCPTSLGGSPSGFWLANNSPPNSSVTSSNGSFLTLNSLSAYQQHIQQQRQSNPNATGNNANININNTNNFGTVSDFSAPSIHNKLQRANSQNALPGFYHLDQRHHLYIQQQQQQQQQQQPQPQLSQITSDKLPPLRVLSNNVTANNNNIPTGIRASSVSNDTNIEPNSLSSISPSNLTKVVSNGVSSIGNKSPDLMPVGTLPPMTPLNLSGVKLNDMFQQQSRKNSTSERRSNGNNTLRKSNTNESRSNSTSSKSNSNNRHRHKKNTSKNLNSMASTSSNSTENAIVDDDDEDEDEGDDDDNDNSSNLNSVDDDDDVFAEQHYDN